MSIAPGLHTAGLEPYEAALLGFVEKLVLRADNVSQPDVDTLHGHGLADEDVVDAVLATADLCLSSKLASGLGMELDAASLSAIEGALGSRLYRLLQER